MLSSRLLLALVRDEGMKSARGWKYAYTVPQHTRTHTYTKFVFRLTQKPPSAPSTTTRRKRSIAAADVKYACFSACVSLICACVEVNLGQTSRRLRSSLQSPYSMLISLSLGTLVLNSRDKFANLVPTLNRMNENTRLLRTSSAHIEFPQLLC